LTIATLSSKEATRLVVARHWIATGNRAERRSLERSCGWPQMDWRATPPPAPELVEAMRA
jgi:hypothetical protein